MPMGPVACADYSNSVRRKSGFSVQPLWSLRLCEFLQPQKCRQLPHAGVFVFAMRARGVSVQTSAHKTVLGGDALSL